MELDVDCELHREKEIKELKEKLKQQSWELGNQGYKIKNQRREINERLKQLEAKAYECEELKEKYKWYDHYKESALLNKDLYNRKTNEANNYKLALNKIVKIIDGVKIDTQYNNSKQIHAYYLARLCDIYQVIDEVIPNE